MTDNWQQMGIWIIRLYDTHLWSINQEKKNNNKQQCRLNTRIIPQATIRLDLCFYKEKKLNEAPFSNVYPKIL